MSLLEPIHDSWIERRHVRESRARSVSPAVFRVLAPTQNEEKYGEMVERSFYAAQGLARSASTRFIRRAASEDFLAHRSSRATSPAYRYRSPLAATPYPTGLYAPFVQEAPIRKYDVYSVRTWSYPIYKYLNSSPREDFLRGHYYRPYNYVTAYTPPLMSSMNTHVYGGYSGVSSLSAEHSFQLTSHRRPNAYKRWDYPINKTPWYRTYGGHAGLTHFGGYRPRYVNFQVTAPWMR